MSTSPCPAPSQEQDSVQASQQDDQTKYSEHFLIYSRIFIQESTTIDIFIDSTKRTILCVNCTPLSGPIFIAINKCPK